MLDWFRKNRPPADYEPPEVIQEDTDLRVRVIGDRASGKTTYMAALARWPYITEHSPIQSITAVNEEGERLVEQARNILEQGLELEPTPLEEDFENVKDYSLSITLREQFSFRRPGLKGNSDFLQLNMRCKDYAGEFFSDLINKGKDPKLVSYLDDCSKAKGVLLLIDGISYRKDAAYADGVKQLLTRLNVLANDEQERRIALVLTKCEQTELWINKSDPDYLVEARFPKTYEMLRSLQTIGKMSFNCFTTSAFGMLGNSGKANAKRLSRGKQGVRSVMKDSKLWRPFGLVAPIYWVCTGKRYQKLDED